MIKFNRLVNFMHKAAMDFNQITALPTYDLMRSQESNLQGLDI
jgi:hypothetical protein